MITRFEQDMDGSMCPEDGGQWVRFDDLVAENAALAGTKLYPRPDPRVSELEAKLQQMNSLCEFNERTMSDIASKYEALEAQIAALLVAIEAKDAALDSLVSWVDDWAETSDTDFPRLEAQVNAARAIHPTTELLEARDRKRDAKLLELVSSNPGLRFAEQRALLLLAADRKFGDWKPELGD